MALKAEPTKSVPFAWCPTCMLAVCTEGLDRHRPKLQACARKAGSKQKIEDVRAVQSWRLPKLPLLLDISQEKGPEGGLPHTQRARRGLPWRLGLDPLPSTVARTSCLGTGRPHEDDVFAEGVRASSDWGSGQIEFARHMGIHRPCRRDLPSDQKS